MKKLGKVLLILLLVLVLLFTVLIAPRTIGQASLSHMEGYHYAHRGYHDGNVAVPENSLSSFQAAIDAGYGIELDVQLSSDKVPMIFHDADLDRICGVEGKIWDYTCAELQEMNLFDTDETIPTFEQVLALVDGRVPLLVELKGEDTNVDLCEKVAAQLSAYKGIYCLESFNPLLIGKIGEYLPNAYRGLLYTNVCRDKKKNSILNLLLTVMALNVIARPDFIAYNEKDRESFPVKLATSFYTTTKFVWTIRTEEGVEEAHRLGEYPIFERK